MTRVKDYAYINTLTHLMKSFMLQDVDYRNLSSAEVSSIINFLNKKIHPNLVELLSEGVIEEPSLDEAILKDYIYVGTILRSHLPPYLSNFFELYFSSFDVSNLKTVIRALMRGYEAEEVKGFLLPSNLGYDHYLKLMESEDIDDLISRLDPILRGFLLEYLNKWRDVDNSFVLEYAVDAFFFKSIWDCIEGMESVDRRGLYEIFGHRIDMINVMNAIRFIRFGMDEKYFPIVCLPFFYKVDEKKVYNMVRMRTIIDALKILRDTTYGKLTLALEKKTPDSIWLAFLRYYKRVCERVFYSYPFQAGKIFSLLELLKLENDNLRYIILSKLDGLSSEEILSRLVI
ncbi:MAG: V-type ATPase subunit [Candidatus Asgardarchaeia archaeon]